MPAFKPLTPDSTPPAHLRLIFVGSGEFGLPTLDTLLHHGHQVVQVVTQPDRPAGRGRALTPTPVGAAAEQAKLPLLKTPNINVETLRPADVMIVIAFGQKLSDPIVRAPRLGSVNLHASLLPKYRGAAPINCAILQGEATTGNSIIRLAQQMDAGAVLAQSVLEIGALETAGELHDRLAIDGAALMLRVLAELASGVARETEQDSSAATLAPKLSRRSALLDFSQAPLLLARRIRGLYPWPGCRVKLCDAAGEETAGLRLVRARPVATDEASRWLPGEVMLSGFVRAGDGAIEIVELQPDGGRAMPLADYRRGRPWLPGMRLIAVE